MPTFVGSTQAGDGQTAQTTSLSVPVHASALAGDLMLISLDNSASANTLTTSPAVVAGPDPNGANSVTWVVGKLLSAGDISAGSISIVFGTSARCTALAETWRDAAVPAAGDVALASETAAVTTYTLPTLGSVAAGSAQVAFLLRRRTGAAGSPSTPAGYTAPTPDQSATAYGSGVNVFSKVAHIVSSAGGTVGGETSTTAVSSVGNNYVVEIPAAVTDTTIPVPSAAVGAAGAAPTPVVAPSVPSAYAPVRSADTGVTASSSPTVPSAAVGAFSDPAAPGTAVPVGTAFVGGSGAAPVVTATAAVPVPSAAVGAAAGVTAVSASATLAAPSAVVGAAPGQPPVPLEIYRYQWWDGAEWHRITPLVWDGAAWLEIPVTVTEPTPEL